MRSLLLIPVSILATALCGEASCAALSRDPHTMEMSWAIAAILAACMAALAPMFFTRNSDQLAVSQAALAGSMLHLFVAILPVGVCIAAGVPLHRAFIYWLVPMYWTSLIALVAIYSRAIKSARPATKA